MLSQCVSDERVPDRHAQNLTDSLSNLYLCPHKRLARIVSLLLHMSLCLLAETALMLKACLDTSHFKVLPQLSSRVLSSFATCCGQS